jgi:hypothetical protein
MAAARASSYAKGAQLAEQRGFTLTSFKSKFDYAKKPLANGTLRSYDATGKYFKRYARYLILQPSLTFFSFLKEMQGWSDETIRIYTSHGAPSIDADTIKNFLLYWVAKGKGRLDAEDSLITRDTIYRRWKNLAGWILRETGKAVEPELFNDVRGVRCFPFQSQRTSY